MSEEPFILDFDANQHAVLEPDHDQLPYHFHSRLLYAFVPKENIDRFLDEVPHKVLGTFDTISFQPSIYEINLDGQLLTLCQAPLGAPAATQLLDWLISYGVKQALAFGNAGALVDLPENTLLIPTRAIRDEGTSFHYAATGNIINLQLDFIKKIEKGVHKLNFKFDEITTWTTVFRETPKKVAQFKQLGAATVEMECSALAACAEFRKVDFAQLLFTADFLAKIDDYDERNWGDQSHNLGLEIGSRVLAMIAEK